jgi:hypothetical protein
VAHHSFELGSGVGLVFQPELGLAGATGIWLAQFVAWAWLAARGGRRTEPLLAGLAGISLSGVLVHFLLWPWRRGRLGLPALTDAEGLSEAQLPVYNAILWAWALSATGSLLFETSGKSRRWALAGAFTLPIFARSAKFHFEWVGEQAKTDPAWWNRALQGEGSTSLTPR